MPSAYYSAWEYPSPVGSGRTSMVPGSFYYDAAASALYVWLADGSNPNLHVIEASVRRRLFFMHQPYVYLKGFAFRHSNASAFTQQGAAVELSAKSVIELCDIQYTDFSGLSMGYLQDGARAQSSTASNNGDSGVVAAGSTNFQVTKVAMNGNNSRNFNPRWHAGGFKGAANAWGIVEDSEVGGNNGSGIWFDYARSGNPVVIRNNYIHDNGPVDSAIFFEVSNTGRIYNNVLARNRLRGIYLAASDNTRVYNNTVVATAERAGIEVAGMPRSGATLTGNEVTNNIVSQGTGQYDLYLMGGNGGSIAGNKSDYNVFHRATGFIELWSNAVYADLAAWRTATGQDAHSIVADPRFSAVTAPPAASNYTVTAGSPAIDAGANLSGVVTKDYLGTIRPLGKAFDIGAFETAALTGATTLDTSPPVVTIQGGASSFGPGGTLTLTASATDNVGVVSMRLYIDEVLKASSAGPEISYAWSAPAVGSHAVRVTATDAAQNSASATSTWTIQ
jgi:parallel beta-helix repeat protein